MKILAPLFVSAALFNSVLGLGYNILFEQSRFLQTLFQSMQDVCMHDEMSLMILSN